MRKLYVLAVACAVSAVPAHAAGVKYRTVQAPYQTPGGVSPLISGNTNLQGKHYGTAQLYPGKGEYAVSLTVADQTGQPVLFDVTQDTNGDGTGDVEYGEFCGSAPLTKLRVPYKPVLVYLQAGQCGTTAVSLPTTGTVTAKFAAPVVTKKK